jgi:hypothetical protein
MRKSPVTTGLAGEVVEDVDGDIDVKGDEIVLVAVDDGTLVKFDTIDKLLSMDSGLPKTTVVVV